MSFTSYKENSRLNWGHSEKDVADEVEKIQLGAILRIADAVETLTKDWSNMKQDLEWYKTAYRSKKEDLEAEVRRKNTYKGHLTRAKNRIKELEAKLAEKDTPPTES